MGMECMDTLTVKTADLQMSSLSDSQDTLISRELKRKVV